ncbi:MAG TPA: LUD domain-containing protein [Pseudonocardiaceae bacterium]
MSDARAEILARIDAIRRPAAAIPRTYRRNRDLGDLVELAADRIADYRATVHVIPAGELVTKIGAVLAERVAHHMLAPAGMPEPWRVDGVTWLVDEPLLSIAELDLAGGVLTGCALVIAETGTIVLDAGPDQGRRALTLIPDYHLCVVRADQIVGTVPEAIARLDPVRPTTFISGPSATSDIEFNRVEGVHGPRTLDVLITT